MEELVEAWLDSNHMELLMTQDHLHTLTMSTKVSTPIIFKIQEVLELDTLKVMILAPPGIIRTINDHLQSTGSERVACTVSIPPFQPSQGITSIRNNHQEQPLLVLLLLTPALVEVLQLRAPYRRRAIQVEQVQVGHDQGQGLSARVVTPSTLREVDLE